jgi:2-hydroxycyclohexanecarboxyl-CoA dehydrogenase
MAGRLDGKIAIVTGAAGGIGSATTRMFCREGARVLATDKDEAGLQVLSTSIGGEFGPASIRSIVVEIGEERGARIIMDAVKAAFGALDILVNVAGMRAHVALADADAGTWESILKVNLLSYAYLTKFALPYLRASKRGSVVNVSSTHAVNPRAGMGQYDVTKAGIVSMTRTLAFEEAQHGIRANAVCPGLTLTPYHLRRAEAEGRSRQDIEREGRDGCVLGRWAEPDEIAAPIVWLASDEASYVTAAVLMVDGGRYVT